MVEVKAKKNFYFEDESFKYYKDESGYLHREPKPKNVMKLLRAGNFPELYIKELFSLEIKETQAITEAKKCIENNRRGLLLSGKAGTGKTFASIFYIKTMIEKMKCYNPLYITAQDLDFTDKEYKEADVILIDDFNKNLRDFEIDYLNRIIYHVHSSPKKHLLITTNASLKDFALLINNEPILSRIKSMCHIAQLKEDKDFRIQSTF